MHCILTLRTLFGVQVHREISYCGFHHHGHFIFGLFNRQTEISIFLAKDLYLEAAKLLVTYLLDDQPIKLG